MRLFALLGWLLVPVAIGAYHYGPGQEQLRLDDTARALSRARAHAEAGRHDQAVAGFERALALLPAGRDGAASRIRLERARSQFAARLLPEANADLEALVEQLHGDPAADPALVADARAALASSQYYLTWLMKLEGLGREQWEPEIESARQTYRLLAEDAARDGDEPRARAHREDLEAAIRLARMEPGELQGLAIPKPCQGCKSGQCKSKRPGKKPSGGPKPPKDARGASGGPPPDRNGS
jgi:tetratricopeptide (TPR) repeat protein